MRSSRFCSCSFPIKLVSYCIIYIAITVQLNSHVSSSSSFFRSIPLMDIGDVTKFVFSAIDVAYKDLQNSTTLIELYKDDLLQFGRLMMHQHRNNYETTVDLIIVLPWKLMTRILSCYRRRPSFETQLS